MAEVSISESEKNLIRDKLTAYCRENLSLELEQFDAEFLCDFVVKSLGPVFYNAGVEEAIRTQAAWSERIQEEMDLKKIY
ncbi:MULTISPECIES: DUF2164 domain-containing protein [Tenebrionibacter/Tenebrionicola group]|jgi:uncharacterized protein (DUF2164 family)|uniref:DUF2164 family protein n=2 Tax=Tenebrionibacter/Tenebrionicola group TaxID=2969848 RepID=A0A8K0XY15_9ENTR|nr:MULTISPECIES: DUF2164 domain-containing protein [Tenebrionibacter/Tenebrionicola group]MBK4716238.1 DUF2164 family protein [Tenebrionibacter intestinalis]MBV4411296.1 DUF2164 family protein [Tenebrionicola larvae]MBV5096893.1 DUF2164 family protein [Tenebrionicola larvae]